MNISQQERELLKKQLRLERAISRVQQQYANLRDKRETTPTERRRRFMSISGLEIVVKPPGQSPPKQQPEQVPTESEQPSPEPAKKKKKKKSAPRKRKRVIVKKNLPKTEPKKKKKKQQVKTKKKMTVMIGSRGGKYTLVNKRRVYLT